MTFTVYVFPKLQIFFITPGDFQLENISPSDI